MLNFDKFGLKIGFYVSVLKSINREGFEILNSKRQKKLKKFF